MTMVSMRNDERMNGELYVALERGHFISIQILHGQNSSVLLAKTFEGDTPLHIAAREGYQDIVEWILHKKPSLAQVKNMDNNTPLHEAAKCGNPDVVRILLQHRKTSVHKYNKFRETPLIIASRHGHVETVKILLEARSYNDEIEMHRSFRVAAYGRYADVTKAILQNPIKPQLFRRLLVALLEWETYEGVAKVIFHNLVKPLEISSLIYIANNLHVAVRGGQLEIVRAVLDSPTWKIELMTEKDECGRCPIHVAAIKGNWDIINEFMLRWPDSVEIQSSDHKSVLLFAIEYNQIHIVQNILSNKSSQKMQELVSRSHDSSHNTGLHLAARNGVDPQLVEYLISFPGVDVNVINHEEMTPLDIAFAEAPHNHNCDIIKQSLEGAGGIQWSLMPKHDTTSHPSNVNDSKKGGDKDIVDTHMVVASLIATVTFATMFQIPGGMEEDKNSIHYGTAKIAFHKLFKFFVFSDIAAFTSSFTVVVMWLLRQLLGDSYSVLSHLSVGTLLFSIWWTTATFVSVTIIVTVPSNYKNLKTTHNKAFSAYESLWRHELYLAIISAVYVGVPLLFMVYGLFMGGKEIKYSKHLFCLQLSLVTLVIFTFTFGK